MIIINDKKTEFHICYDVSASECIRFAANELQKYLYASTKCVIPLFSSKCDRRGVEIHLGLNVRGKDYSKYVKDLSDEGFAIVEDLGDLAFVSKSSRGVLYAVYNFLEHFIKLNALDSEMIVYENVNEIDVKEDIIVDLPFEYRECYFTDSFNGKYASMNMLNSNLADLSVRLGGKTKWYNFHHSFADLINPKEYFDIHPEYFSEIDGVRVKEHTELCLSNEEVFQICLARVKKWIKDNPTCKVFSVAQDEWMGHFIKMACECKDCKAFDEAHGSQSASIIRFVNRIASALEEEYPDILIHTFAYQYSRKPPVGLEVHKNVIVRLTNIECSWADSIEEGALKDPHGRNASFLEDLKGWSKLTNRLYIWDYSVNYRNYLLPFPCFRSMAKNIKLYKEIGVKGLLMQGNFSNGGKGYFDELKSFVSAKMMQCDYKLEDLINNFCDNYYGKASKYVQEYLYLFEDNIKDKTLWLYDDADSLLFNDEIVSKARLLINKALDAAKSESELIKKHLNILELTIRYLELVRLPMETLNRSQLIDKFDNDLREYGITELFERTNLDYSINVMKKSLYAKDRPNWYSLYYIMK
mgnify:CR=1 FL=1